ncbi:MAG TPA: hypothetical protein VGD88_05755 [Opitutaceae bacterium]
MRTTLTIDDDLAVEIKRRVRRSGAPFRDVVNDLLRAGMAAPAATATVAPHVTAAHDFGLGSGHDHVRAWDLLAAEDAAEYRASQP